MTPPLVTILLNVLNFINAVLVPLILALAFVFFLWGVFQYFIAGAADEEKRKEGRKFVLWSMIGFFIMFSLWGIVNIFMTTFGFRTDERPRLPTFGGPTSGYGVGTRTTTSGSPAYGFNNECFLFDLCMPDNHCVSGRCVPRPANDQSSGSFGI